MTSTPNNPNETTICPSFLQGSCNEGNNCPFSHVIGDATRSAGANPADLVVGMLQLRQGDSMAELNAAEDDKENCWHRQFGGAVVQFGDGAAVTKVSFASDFSAVRLTNLSANVTANALVRTFARIGEQVSVDNICMTMSLQDATGSPVPVQADIRVEDPRFAARVCGMRELAEYLPAKLPTCATAAQHLARTNITSLQWADSKKVLVLWQNPTKTVNLAFGSRQAATSVNDLFNDGLYGVRGLRIASKLNYRLVNMHRYGVPTVTTMVWTIALEKVPVQTTIFDITGEIHKNLQPVGFHEENGQSVAYRDRAATVMILSHLAHAGEIVWSDSRVQPSTAGNEHRVEVQFLTETGAARAVRWLNNRTLLRGSSEVLTVKVIHTVRIKVSAVIYNAVAAAIISQVPVWRQGHVLFTAYPPTTGFVVIKLEGTVRKYTASAKARLEKMLRGRVIYKMDGKTPRWASELAKRDTNGDPLVPLRIQELQAKYGVAIICDRHKRQVRLVGTAPQRDNGKAALVRYIDKLNAAALAAEAFTITLSYDMILWLSNSGADIVKKALGKTNLKLELASEPRRAILSDEESYRTALHIFRTLPDHIYPGRESTTHMVTCCICWTEDADIITTPCRHNYCRSCFESMCRTNVNKGIQCLGDADSCKAQLPLSLLQKNLSPAAFERLLQDAFKAHMQHNFQQLRNCPTADCEQAYRAPQMPDIPGLDAECSTCLACMASVCRRCNAVHEGLVCEEYQDQASGGYRALERAKAEFGIKECPNCGTLIQKTEGCNHITCPGCDVHLCWSCMQQFEEDFIYIHMLLAHGTHIDVDE
ncbi:zinc c2h2 finger domain containing protein [Ophiostoma piceae UAMH 11346]|uniref:Zinc c2h2 finger domain containing protein n=1 Tax=Ophiostoma piceae (strain UAMH 11346) TaxID=1262450 RepID=S3DBC6_OPHP1|nr:zinc c2h2 finger domain containing protein [Ophiostoma piceae UAMH 11346]